MDAAERGKKKPAASGGKKKKGKGKGKGGAEPETHRCFHCQSEGTKMMRCSQCHFAWYCGQPCQKKHWKQHKRACVGAVAAQARHATQKRRVTAARGGGNIDKETCVICVGPVVAPVELPCGHAYCGACLAELRTKQVAQACPMCREELPPGLDGLLDLAFRAVWRILGMVDRGEMAWATLPPAEQEEIDEALAMLTEAVAQGRHGGQGALTLGFLLQRVRNDSDGAEAAYRAAVAADPGCGEAHTNLGNLLHAREDFDGAEAAFRAAIAADPGFAKAHNSLGALLKAVRKDFDGAEAAYRASIALDPGDATARYNLGTVLQNQRKDYDGAEAAYRAAIALDPGYAKAHSNLGGLLLQIRKDYDGAEAAFRAAIAAEPGYANAHTNLGSVLSIRAGLIERGGGDMASAAALYDEAAAHYSTSLGAGHQVTKEAKADAARIRAALA